MKLLQDEGMDLLASKKEIDQWKEIIRANKNNVYVIDSKYRNAFQIMKMTKQGLLYIKAITPDLDDELTGIYISQLIYEGYILKADTYP